MEIDTFKCQFAIPTGKIQSLKYVLFRFAGDEQATLTLWKSLISTDFQENWKMRWEIKMLIWVGRKKRPLFKRSVFALDPHTPHFNSACIVNLPKPELAFFGLAPGNSKGSNIEVGGVGKSTWN